MVLVKPNHGSQSKMHGWSVTLKVKCTKKTNPCHTIVQIALVPKAKWIAIKWSATRTQNVSCMRQYLDLAALSVLNGAAITKE